jgi:hypothetical protein
MCVRACVCARPADSCRAWVRAMRRSSWRRKLRSRAKCALARSCAPARGVQSPRGRGGAKGRAKAFSYGALVLRSAGVDARGKRSHVLTRNTCLARQASRPCPSGSTPWPFSTAAARKRSWRRATRPAVSASCAKKARPACAPSAVPTPRPLHVRERAASGALSRVVLRPHVRPLSWVVTSPAEPARIYSASYEGALRVTVPRAHRAAWPRLQLLEIVTLTGPERWQERGGAGGR